MTGSGSIALIVPPLAVPESTHFNGQLGVELTGMPVLTIPDNQYLLSPILSLSPHDVEFQQKVAIRFPVAAVVKGWLLRLICCPFNGDRWEAIVDMIVPHSMSASSLLIMSHGDTLYDADSELICVDHFCYKCWVGVPLRHNVKKRIWCALFGRPLGSTGKWEVIVRCFDPYMELYNRVADMMADYGAEPLIDAPESLEIGKSGVVRIALEQGGFPWLLDGGDEEVVAPASSTFWERPSETLLGCRCKFVVRPEKDTDYVRVLVSISYINSNSTKRPSQSVQLDGTAPILGRGSWDRSSSESSHSSIYNVTNCNDVAIGSDNQFVHCRPAAVSLPVADPSSETWRSQTEGFDCANGVFVNPSVSDVQPDSTTSDGRVILTPRSAKRRTKKSVPECGQQVW